MSPSRPIRVLVIDDSALVRRAVSEALKPDPAIEVVGTAADPYIARDLIEQRSPDVLTLDLEMPRMDGLTFLELLMKSRPMPVVVMSSLSQRGSDYALEALRLGAVDVMGKPGPADFRELGPQLATKIRAAAAARLGWSAAASAAPVPPAPAPAPAGAALARAADPRRIILLGSSTGGVEALRHILTALPAGLPPIVAVQHIPAVFSRNLAARLDQLCALEVHEAADGETLRPGTVLIAPGDRHLMLHWREGRYCCRVMDGPPVWHQRPAVDLLFASAAAAGAAPHCVAGLLTGMGRDGAEGLLQLRQKGAATFAQDEATSVVFGMPRAAWLSGAAERLLPLGGIAPFLAHALPPLSHNPVLAASIP